jgi:uncharacterized protein YbaR (Trm112 family)
LTLDFIEMFIELTDHLRCPADHEESFLVLLPDRLDGRWVKSGQFGCPVCGRTFEMIDGVFDTGDGPAPTVAQSNSGKLDAAGLTALIGINGPGGYLVLVGSLGGLWKELSNANPGVGLVAVDPGPDVIDGPGVSVIRSGRIPVKSRSMRGAVLSRPFADDPGWVKEAARVVLPGLRVVGEGPDPPADLIELMASAGGVWVGTAVRKA